MMYLYFKLLELRSSECVCFTNDWHNVDKVVELFHELNVEGLKPGRGETSQKFSPHTRRRDYHNSPVATRVDEVETAVNSMVFNVSPVQTRLITEVLIILVVDIVNYGLPAV